MVRGSDNPNRHTTYNGYGEIYGSYDWRRAGTTSLGVNYTHHMMFSNKMGEELASPSHRVPGRPGSFYTLGVARGTVSAWGGHFVSLGSVWLHALGSVVHTPYGTDGTFGANAGWNIDRTFTISGGLSRSARLPTFTELYYNVATYHPNPNLKPETAMMVRLTVDAAGRVGSGDWKVAVSGWYRHTRDVIDWEQRPGTTIAPDGTVTPTADWWSTQLNRLGTAGVELSARYSSKGWFRVAMLNYGYIHSDKSVATGYISKYALDYMRHKVSAVVGVAFLRGFTFTLTGAFYDRVGSYIAVDGAQQSYKPYFLLDGRLAWERGAVQLYVDVANMTDTRYFDFGGLPMPGPWATGGVVVTIH
jgi:iron complex outermembrane receptor protein